MALESKEAAHSRGLPVIISMSSLRGMAKTQRKTIKVIRGRGLKRGLGATSEAVD